MAGKKKTEPRRLRVYKATDALYNRAMKRATKDKIKLTQLLEQVIRAYGGGFIISVKNRAPMERQENDLLKKKSE